MSSRGRLTALTLAFAILGLALLAGCGGGGPRDPSADEQAAIEARLDDYTQGFADGDPKAICATFVPEEIDALGGQDACIKAYASIAKAHGDSAGAITSVDIDHIDVADDGSIARLYPVGATLPIRFEPVGDDWYVVPPAALPGQPAPSTSTTTTTESSN